MYVLPGDRIHQAAFVVFILLCGFSSIKVPLSSPEYWLIVLFPLLFVGGGIHKVARRDTIITVIKAPFFPWLCVAWFVFVAGIVVAAAANDGTGLYTSAKFIALFLICVYLIIVAPAQNLVLLGLKWWCAMALVAFLGLWIAGAQELLILPPMRYGWIWAPPGIMWKAGMYLAPVCLWVALTQRGRFWPWVWLALSCFVVSLDGSRTGVLLFGLIWLALSILALVRYGVSFALARRCVVVAAFTVVALGVFNPAPWNPLEEVHDYAKQFLPTGPSIVVPPPPPGDQREITSDSIRIAMLKEGIRGAVHNFPLGAGFGATNVPVAGSPHPMVVHMTYLQVLSDLGLIGLLGYLVIFAVPLGMAYQRIWRLKGGWDEFDRLLLPLSIVGIYMAIGMLHPLSNEISEWGIVLLAFALILSPSKEAAPR